MLAIWLASRMFGAGAGSRLAWLRVDRRNTPVLSVTAISAVAASTLGAWVGYENGSNREIEVCAVPTASPVSYTALGATLGVNVAVVTTSLLREFLERRVRTRIQDGVV